MLIAKWQVPIYGLDPLSVGVDSFEVGGLISGCTKFTRDYPY